MSGANHNDIEYMNRREYFTKLKEFLNTIKNLQDVLGSEFELLKAFHPRISEVALVDLSGINLDVK